MAFYVTTRVQQTGAARRHRSAFVPGTLWLLSRLEIGRAMAFVGEHGESMVTSRVQRILRAAANDAFYVQTANSMYELRRAPLDRGRARAQKRPGS